MIPMQKEFACPTCQSPSVIYPDRLGDNDKVLCRACGTPIATMAQFRRFIENHTARSELHSTGC
jgi:hypothetical protein